MVRGIRALGVAGVLAAGLLGPAASAQAPRFPVWPTEVDRVAAPIYGVGTENQAGERQRADAVAALDEFATPVIVMPLLVALDDPAVQVRREALRLCWERRVADCIDGAATLFGDGPEPSLRIAALRVLAMEAGPRSAAILIGALRDKSEAIRAQAAQFLGTAPLSPALRGKARRALLAKLPDGSAVTRRRAVEALGLLGPGDGALAVARVLDDPEPTVRAAAARALGRMRDAQTVPALARALEAPNEPIVTKALVEALAQLADESREPDLLRLLDEPPTGLSVLQVSGALSLRPEPGDALVDGLIQRLREAPLREACLDVLLVYGDNARPGIERALQAGVEPPLAVELQRLQGALQQSATPPRPAATPGIIDEGRWPAATEVATWTARMTEGDARDRVSTGLALGARSPAWMVPSALARLAQAGPAVSYRAWLAALATSPRQHETTDAHAVAVARLVAWAHDPRTAVGDRCLATLALGTVGHGRMQPLAAGAVETASKDPKAGVRACAVAVMPRVELSAGHLEAMLADPDARVRAVAALAATTLGDPPRSLRRRLAVVATTDDEGHVRRAARLARERLAAAGDRRSVPRPAVGVWGLAGGDGLGPRRAWITPVPWRETDMSAVALPAVGHGAMRWVVVPGERRPVASQ